MVDVPGVTCTSLLVRDVYLPPCRDCACSHCVPPKLQKMFSDKSFSTGLHLVLHIACSTRSFAEVNFTGKSGDGGKEGRVNIDKLNIEDKKPKGRTLETQFRSGKVC